MSDDTQAQARRGGDPEAADRRLRAVFESAIDFAIIATDRNGKVTDWNTGAERILGWSAEEMSGDTVERFFTPDDRANGRPEKEMRLSLRDGRASDERWHLRKDGSRFWASGELMPLRGEGGEHLGFVKILRDRTAEQRGLEALRAAEDRLRESEDHLRHTVEFNPQVTWTADPQGNITSYSNQWLELTGQAPGEPDGSGWIKALHPDDVEPSLAVFSACLASGEPVDVDYRIWAAATREHRWMRARAYPRRDEQGRIVRWYGVVEDDHDRKTAELALRESEEQFRVFAEAVPNHLWASHPNGELYWFNEQVYAYAGAEHGTLDGPAWTRIVHPDDLPEAAAAWASALETSEVYEAEFRIRRADGAYRWFLVRAEPVRAADGGIVRWVGTNTDIEERRQQAAALRELNATLEDRIAERTAERDRAWKLSQDLLVVAAPNGRLEALNAAWTKVLGWNVTDLVGKPFAEFTHPDDLEATLAAFAGIFERPLTVPYEYRLRHRDGTYRWFAWTGTFEDGKVYASGRDVTAVHERDAKLRDFEDFARLALSSVGGVGVWTYEMASDRFACDAAISELYGLDPEQAAVGILRQEFLANVHPDDMAKLRATMAVGLQNAGDLELEYRLKHPDGSIRWVLSRGHTYFDEAGNPVRRTGVGVETTKQRQLEEALRQSQKMEAVGQLTGGLAHDFNNLLAGITGSLELLDRRIAQGRIQDAERFVTAAQGAAKRAAALTHRLLAFSRRQTLDPKPTNVNKLVADMDELVRRTVGPEIVLEVVAAAGLWATLVDPNQLENALLNLCINARDAMRGGGKLTIETGNRWIDHRAAKERDLTPGQYISMCVSDSGTGMPPDVVAKAFDPFFTTKPIGQGTGLGLSMIYGFARQTGGQVRIYSEVGEGTMVCIYLPRFIGEAGEADAIADLSEAPRAGDGETVLVVDDEPTVRMLVTEVLEEFGYAAIEAADGASGLKVLQSDVRIDLLVTDVGLPGGMNGRQMADAARETRPRLKVLFITGYAENAVVGHGHLDPGMHVMTKPFALEALASRIKELIAAR